MSRWWRRWSPSAARRGQTMVDFAILVPLAALLLMGVFDFSLAVARGVQLAAAVQEGVSYARANPSDAAGIRAHVKHEGLNLSLNDADISITCFAGLSTTTISCTAATFGDSVKVQATYRYSPITGRLVAITGSPIMITQSASSEIY